MNSPIDGPENYAPKWVREDEFPPHSEQPVPKDGLIPDQTRAHRPLDRASLREVLDSLAWRPRPESLPETDEEPPLHMRRSLDPQFLRDPPRASRAIGRLAVVLGLIIAASVGAAIALFATGKLPSELNKTRPRVRFDPVENPSVVAFATILVTICSLRVRTLLESYPE
jgi:hypothetical protein